MKKTLSGLIRLTRFNEFGYFIIITTLTGIASAQGVFSARLVGIVLANWLAVCFAYMLNDIEDAPEDAFSSKNYWRNPISSGLITTKTAKWAATLVALIAMGLYALLGLWTFIFWLIGLSLGMMYSVKIFRLKNIPLLDIFSRGLILAGLPFLCGYFAFADALNRNWLWPFLFVMSLSVFYDRPGQGKPGEEERSRLQQTAAMFGQRSANLIKSAIIITVITTGIITLFLIDLIPGWVMIMISVLVMLFFLPPYIKTRKNTAHELVPGFLISTLERSAAIGLTLQFLLPWMVQLINAG